MPNVTTEYFCGFTAVRQVLGPFVIVKAWLKPSVGGFVFGGASEQDDLLRTLADKLSMTIVAVEYRLAPENPFPACVHDCLAAALYCLSSEGTSTLQGRLRAIGGDSAGAYLALKVTLDLRDRGIQVHEDIAALILLYGVFSLSPTPSLASHTREIILSRRDMEKFIEAAFPCAEAPLASRSHHGQSVLYESLVALPPAFILCGTQDPLIDDSVFLAGRYYIAGNEVEIRIEREAPHAFITIPMGEASETGMEAILNYMRSRMRKATGE